MTPAEATAPRPPLTREEVEGLQSLEPLRLGDALSFIPEPERGHVRVDTAFRTVFVGTLGMVALRDWLAGSQAKPTDEIELWTATGIKQEVGVASRTVYKWTERDDFPRPFAHPVGGAPVWEADRVRAWLLTSRPRAGRPSKAS